MMAFFLLMWLLGATDEKKRKGLACYFNPSLVISRSSAGGAGMLEGTAAFTDSPTSGTEEEGVLPKPTHQDDGPQLGYKDAGPDVPINAMPGEFIANGTAGEGDGDVPAGDAAGEGTGSAGGTVARDADEDTESDAEDGLDGTGDLREGDPDAKGTAAFAAGQSEQDRLEAIGRQIAEAMRETEDGALENHFFLRVTADGLVIEIIDADYQPLFGSGSAGPASILPILIDVLVLVLNETINDIAAVGQTDAVPFGGADYSNWELSADRANVARQLLISNGLPESRVVRVTGKAAVEPLVANPEAAQNRRISITLLRNFIR
jgi:chemotaxis protein MotB